MFHPNCGQCKYAFFSCKTKISLKLSAASSIHSKGIANDQRYLIVVQKWNEIFKVKIKALASNARSELFMEDVFYTKGKIRLTGKCNEGNNLSKFLSFVIQGNLIFFCLTVGISSKLKNWLRSVKNRLAQNKWHFVIEIN